MSPINMSPKNLQLDKVPDSKETSPMSKIFSKHTNAKGLGLNPNDPI